MGDINQLIFIQKHKEKLNKPFLEVGSKDYGSTQDLRGLVAEFDEYIGVDMEEGPGVDVVLDLTEDFAIIDAKLSGKRFNTIFCLSVLEHCDQPFKMAENLTKLLNPNGRIFLSVPFSWKIHAYPSDYWRFTPEGVKKLFPKLEMDIADGLAFTSKKNEYKKLDQYLTQINFSFSYYCQKKHFLRAISAKMFYLLSSIGIFSWLSGYKYLYPPTMIAMVGKLTKH